MKFMKKILLLLSLYLFALNSYAQNNDSIISKQDAILEKYLINGARKHHYLSKEWNEWIDKGLQQDSSIAYLWQQKALPFWKQKKYDLAISYYNKAVELDKKSWLARLAFLKCIFAKDYNGALSDFIAYIKEFGSIYEQDHTLEFYMGICYLQLGQYNEAQNILKENILNQEKVHDKNWIPYLDRYYLGIAYFEQNNYKAANSEFDKVLDLYPNFSDVQFYKSLCLNYLGEKETANKLMEIGKTNFKSGYTFNEDSNLYENYPYQITWQWKALESMLK